MRKVLLTLFILALLASSGAAAIDEVTIVNVFPDEESLDRNTQMVARFDSDATTTTTAQAWLFTPEQKWIKDGEETITVKKGAPLEKAFRFNSTFFDDYGTYMMKINQTNNNLNDSFDFSIRPRPQVNIKVGDLVKDPKETALDLIIVNVNPLIGRTISTDDLKDANLSIYRITGDSTTPTGVEKELYAWQEPGISNETGDFEAIIDFSGAPEGPYEVFLTFNVSTCDLCPTFDEVESETLRVRNDSVSNMSSQLGVVLSLLFAGFLFAFIGTRLNTDNKFGVVMRLFLLMIAPLFAVFAVFTGGQFARLQGFTSVSGYMDYVFLGTFFAWFFFVFVIGVVMYLNEDFKKSVTGALTGDYEPERV